MNILELFNTLTTLLVLLAVLVVLSIILSRKPKADNKTSKKSRR